MFYCNDSRYILLLNKEVSTSENQAKLESLSHFFISRFKSYGMNSDQFFLRNDEPNYLDSLRTLPGPVPQTQSKLDSNPTPIVNTESGNVKSQFKLPSLIPKSSKTVTFQTQPETILPSMTLPPTNMPLLKLSPPTLSLPPQNSPTKSLKRHKKVTFTLPPLITYDCDHN